MKCRLIRPMESSRREDPPGTIFPIGTVIENPKAYRLVQLGCAEPADAECLAAAGMNPQKFAEAVKAQNRLSAGIHPDDYAAFDAGWMVGYAADGDGVGPNGEWIPGPNYHEFERQCEELIEQEEEGDE